MATRRGAETVRSTHVQGMRIDEVSYDPGLVIPPHAHETGSFSLVLCGELIETVAGAVSRASAGSVVCKPPGVVHENRFGAEGARVLAVVFESPSRRPRGALASMPFPRWKWSSFGNLARILLQLGSVVREDAADLDRVVERESGQLLVASHDAPGDARVDRGPGWLGDAVRDIEERFPEPLRVQDVARRAGVHPVYLARVFRRTFGCSVSEMIRTVRLRAASARIAGGHGSLAEIAAAAGFADQAHLSRTFRTATGLTPGAFRRFVADSRRA